ncbi:hypothetical protein E5161_10395 [Cohnella pontilimi]|uniref:Putative amidase domain-containing protein n=1 Tax=Cohnella pontilimi TaxID=2564100 RepID=A0A4U0FDR1_9BACL|nr:amidase domain-containing protein [Cohnella pontilimi]TJY42394.1 hypothetical protein E5161_10395 [Cohnella pontilimi]
MPESKINPADWKQAIVGYVNAVNEAGLRGDTGLLYTAVPDAAHRNRLAARAQALWQREAERGIRALRSEIRARIERYSAVGAGDKELVADIALHTVRSFEQMGTPWLEERVERERIRLVRIGREWSVDTIEPLDSEGRLVTVAQQEEEEDAGFVRRSAMPSVPFLNPEAMNRFKSRVYAGDGPDGVNWHGGFQRGVPYRREAVVAYAERWWNDPNPQFEPMEVNCTNYVSQCLFAGQAPMNYTGKRETGWWYKGRVNGQERWSYSWAVANSLRRYLAHPRAFGMRAEQVDYPGRLRLGDVICYDWDGNGRVGHNTIVTGFAPDGMPLVNANTVSSRHRYWDYRDSYAWTERTRYHFFHIADEF